MDWILPGLSVVGMADVEGLIAALNGKSAIGHMHPIGEVTGLETALNNFSLAIDDKVSKPVAFNDGNIPVYNSLGALVDAGINENSFIAAAAKGAANGVASLDGTGKVPTAQLPDSVLGQVEYQGTWNAATNSPAIPAAGLSNKGHYRTVSTAGSTSIDGITDWKVGDWIISNGTTWEKVDNTDQVVSVNGFSGAVVLTAANVGAQAVDATLTSLAAFNSNGLLTQTAADTFTARTITGTANLITVTNGNGVNGNPTITVGANVARQDQANNFSANAQTFGSIVATAITSNISTQRIEAAKGAALVGTRKRINFIEGANVTITAVDDNANDRIDITIAAAGGGGGTPGGNHTQVQWNNNNVFAGVAGSVVEGNGVVNFVGFNVKNTAGTQLIAGFDHGAVRRFSQYVQADGGSWRIARYNDSGVWAGDTVIVNRSDGSVFFEGFSTSGVAVFNGSGAITANPTGGGVSVGWKQVYYGSNYALGIAAYTYAIKSDGYISLFSTTNPAGDANGTTPDSNSKVSFSHDFGVWFSNDTYIKRTAAGILTSSGSLKTNQHFLLGTDLPARHTQTVGYKAVWVGDSNCSVMGETSIGYKGITLMANVVRNAAIDWTTADTTKPAWIVNLGYDTNNDQFSISRFPATAGALVGTTYFSINAAGNATFSGAVGAASFNKIGNLAVKTDMAVPANGEILKWVTANGRFEAGSAGALGSVGNNGDVQFADGSGGFKTLKMNGYDSGSNVYYLNFGDSVDRGLLVIHRPNGGGGTTNLSLEAAGISSTHGTFSFNTAAPVTFSQSISAPNVPLAAFKRLNATNVNSTNNTTAAVDAGDLNFSIGANETWSFETFIRVGCSGTGGVKFAVTYTGTLIDLQAQIEGNAASATAWTSAIITASGTLTTVNFNTVAQQNGIVYISGTIRSNGAGTLKIQFASTTAGQTSTVYAGSHLNARKVA